MTVAALVALQARASYMQQAVQPVNDGPNPFVTVLNWAKLPEGRSWGATAAIHVDRDGRSIWVAERCGNKGGPPFPGDNCTGSPGVAPVMKFDAGGKLVQSFGAGMFIFPHGIHVDRDGNVWVTDQRSATPEELQKFPDDKDKGHRVVKFSPDGKVLMILGQGGMAGTAPDGLTEPLDVVTTPNGDVFVSEGHQGQNRVAPEVVARISKFDRNGKFIKSWGNVGSGPSEFRTPHALGLDSRGRIIVADRGNHRLQVFDQDGKYLEELLQFGRVSDIHIDQNDGLYAIDSESNANNHPGWRKGVRIGSLRDATIRFFIPGHQTNSPDGAAGEGVTVDADGNVYAAEVSIRSVSKYARQ
jgi:sugar lactone lactonase YvrE